MYTFIHHEGKKIIYEVFGKKLFKFKAPEGTVIEIKDGKIY